jgi:thiol-disulfide isomerase/thioredoxin
MRKMMLGLFLVSLALGCDAAKLKPSGAAPAPVEQAAEESAVPTPTADSDEGSSQVTLAIKDYDGIVELIKSHQGKVAVVDCWSTWCEPCMKEFPGLVALHEKYGADKIACISIALDYDGTAGQKPEGLQENVLTFLQSQRATFDNVLSSTPADDLMAQLKFPAPPTIFVYDQQGELAKQFDGPEAKYEANIAPFVAKLLDGEGRDAAANDGTDQ